MQILALNIAAYSEIQFNALACAFQTFKKNTVVHYVWARFASYWVHWNYRAWKCTIFSPYINSLTWV